jgi:predicted LPLAT superfamily acyltransferase
MSASSETANSSTRWTRIAERGSLLGLRITVWCYRWLGRRACVALANAVVAYFFLTDRAGRRASRAYLRRVAAHPRGRARLGPAPGAWHSFLRYRAFGLTLVDRLAIWSGHSRDLDFEVHGIELVDRLHERKQGALVIGAHLGSFDAMRLLAERTKTHVNVLMYTEHAQRINRIFRELAPEVAERVIAVDPTSVHSVFEVRERLARGEVVALLGDRVEPGDRGRVSRVSFLGDPVDLPQAPFLLAHLLGCPVLLMIALRAGDRRYEVFTEKLCDRVRLSRRDRDKQLGELLTAYAGRLEHWCLEAPHQWFNFYDYWGDAERA